MRAPERSVALSRTEPNMCAIGSAPPTTSSAPRRVSGKEAKPRSIATAPACVCAALLGRPVVPLELMSSAIACGSTAGRAAGSSAGSDSSANTSAAPAASTRRGSRARVGDDEARAGLTQEGAELACGEQRARRGQRQAGAQGAVHRHREAGSIGGHERDDVAATCAARVQAGGEARGAGDQLPVGDRPPLAASITATRSPHLPPAPSASSCSTPGVRSRWRSRLRQTVVWDIVGEPR